jgi:hypothetical protein
MNEGCRSGVCLYADWLLTVWTRYGQVVVGQAGLESKGRISIVFNLAFSFLLGMSGFLLRLLFLKNLSSLLMSLVGFVRKEGKEGERGKVKRRNKSIQSKGDDSWVGSGDGDG